MARGPADGLEPPRAGHPGPLPSSGPWRRPLSRLLVVSLVTSGWALLYALYRGYYGLGGTAGMFGRPASQAEWRGINLAAAAVLLVVALLPVAALPLWRRPRWRGALVGVCWVLAVGFVMHALVDDVQRVLSLARMLDISYPFFATVDKHAADIQDLAFNETWFLAEGLLWGTLALMVLGPSPARRWWTGTALAAIAVLTATGLLSAFGVIGRMVIL